MIVENKGQLVPAAELKSGSIFFADRPYLGGHSLHMAVTGEGPDSGTAWLSLQPLSETDNVEVLFRGYDPRDQVFDVSSSVEFVPILEPGSFESCFGAGPVASCVYPTAEGLSIAAEHQDNVGRSRTKVFDLESGVERPLQERRELAIKQWEIRWCGVEGAEGLVFRFDGSDKVHGRR